MFYRYLLNKLYYAKHWARCFGGIQKWIQTQSYPQRTWYLIEKVKYSVCYHILLPSCCQIFFQRFNMLITTLLTPVFRVTNHYGLPLTLPVLALKGLCPGNSSVPSKLGKLVTLAVFECLQWLCDFSLLFDGYWTNLEKCSQSFAEKILINTQNLSWNEKHHRALV